MIKDVVFEETHDNAMNVETEPRKDQKAPKRSNNKA